MLFNSFVYIFLFFPVVVAVYFFLNKKRLVEGAKAWLVLASLFFYSYWKLDYLPIILTSIVFNYVIGGAISSKEEDSKSIRVRKKTLLVLGCVFNVSILAYFKYFNFFIENIDALLGLHINTLSITLPLAISFFTFQQIAYLVDSYKGETKEYDFLSYCFFVTFFPQLIAGPIVHHKEMMPQFNVLRNKVLNYKNIGFGLFIFTIGLFKKVGIADTLSPFVHQGFDVTNEHLDFFEGWFVALSYTFQLYFDFSGYCDMAIGSALIFNIKLPINFNDPYLATSIQDFWRRWHITLSRWLRDYLYIPLGGNRGGEVRACMNVFVTFLIGGLWHGAGWTFILWGALHGLGLVVCRLWKKLGISMNVYLARTITFLFVVFGWVFFRAKDFSSAINVFKAMFGFNGIVFRERSEKHLAFLKQFGAKFGDWLINVTPDENHYSHMVNTLILAFVLVFISNRWQKRGAWGKYFLLNEDSSNIEISWIEAGVSIVLLFAALSFMMINSSEFLYFNF